MVQVSCIHLFQEPLTLRNAYAGLSLIAVPVLPAQRWVLDTKDFFDPDTIVCIKGVTNLESLELKTGCCCNYLKEGFNDILAAIHNLSAAPMPRLRYLRVNLIELRAAAVPDLGLRRWQCMTLGDDDEHLHWEAVASLSGHKEKLLMLKLADTVVIKSQRWA